MHDDEHLVWYKVRLVSQSAGAGEVEAVFVCLWQRVWLQWRWKWFPFLSALCVSGTYGSALMRQKPAWIWIRSDSAKLGKKKTSQNILNGHCWSKMVLCTLPEKHQLSHLWLQSPTKQIFTSQWACHFHHRWNVFIHVGWALIKPEYPRARSPWHNKSFLHDKSRLYNVVLTIFVKWKLNRDQPHETI